MENAFKTISAAEFAALDHSKYTLVDLREPDELLVSGIAGAINIPFSQFAAKLDDIPKDKPVIVYCRVGDFSEQIAEILADRGYDVAHVEGGYNAYRRLTECAAPPEPAASTTAEPVLIDAKGLKCPGPIVKIADFLRDQPDGTRVHVEATEDAFYSDIQVWCARTGNRLDNMLMWIAFSFFNSTLMYYVTMLLGLSDNYAVIVMAAAMAVGVATYPLVNFLASRVGKKALLLFACTAYVLIYTGIFFSAVFVRAFGAAATGILIGVLIGFPISITNIIPVAAFADLAQYDTIQTGQNRQAMFVASRNLLQQLSQAVVLFIVPIVITGSVADGVAYYGGVRRTALIAAGFILGALLCYVFYRDKRITTAINQYNERQHRGNEERT